MSVRPDLIGERCSGCGATGVLVQWVHGAESYGLILLDDGTLRFVDVEHLRFPPRTEQPDELREAAETLLVYMSLSTPLPDARTMEAAHKLRKALNQ